VIIHVKLVQLYKVLVVVAVMQLNLELLMEQVAVNVIIYIMPMAQTNYVYLVTTLAKIVQQVGIQVASLV